MAFKYKYLEIKKLSVIGAGQIGPDICLHFAKVFCKHNVELVIVDISENALAKSKAKIEKKINRRAEIGAFKPEMAKAMLEEGVYVIAFSYPVVPEGKARIRVQISSEHTHEDLNKVVEAFVKTRG